MQRWLRLTGGIPSHSCEDPIAHILFIREKYPDIPAAAIGSGAVRDFQGHLYIGTSSWLTCDVPFKKTDIVHSMATLPSAIPGRYFIANEQETADACLNFLRDNIVYLKDQLLAEESCRS
jgi:xylulokinase